MNDSQNEVLDELVIILNKIRDNKTYGSVEIYFENGEITQLTQRIISKVKKTPNFVKKTTTQKIVTRHNHNEDLTQRIISNLE